MQSNQYYKMLLHYVIFIILFNIQQLHGLQTKIVAKQSIRSAYGKYLSGHVFNVTSQAAHIQHCLADCWAENDRCQSFNYIVDLNKCELNEASNLTNPRDLIDRPDMVYLTNPMFGRENRPQMPRYTKQIPVTPLDPCASNPCEHAKYCVKDDKVGYRCENCHSGYHGPRCEEYVDPCSSNPCQWGGTCHSVLTSWRCECPFPFTGSRCTDMNIKYQFDLDGTGDHPHVTMKSHAYSTFTANFWFKTAEKNVSYLIYGISSDDHERKERFIVWRVDNIFFVELWKDSVCNFTFPTSYPVNDNNWHAATMVLDRNAELSFYLDGVMRDSPKLTEGEPNRQDFYRWSTGKIHLGYFKDSNGEEHFFNGSIAHFDIEERSSDYDYIRDYMVLSCPPRFLGRLFKAKWARLIDLARPVTCSSRVPLMGIATHQFYSTSTLQWLETEVSPPRHLTAFTIIFDLHFPSQRFPTKPIQIACYGDQGTPCRLSIVIHVNVTLEIIIESTRFDVDLLPLFNGVHFIMVLTWTNNGGVFELLINGVLHSRIRDIEANGEITGQNRFIIGGSDVKSRNFAGYFHYFNVWDKVLSEDMLYLMNLQPGIDMGNVVAWKDFKKPQEQFLIHKRDMGSTYRRNPFGMNNFFLEFKNASAYSRIPTPCCSSRTAAVTVTMWFKMSTFLPSTLFTFKRTLEEPEDMVLRVKAHGEIMLAMDINTNLEEASLGNISTSSSWNFVAFTWNTGGELHCNINGKHKQISSNFKQGYHFDLSSRASLWTIGDRNNTLVGKVAQVNWWFLVVPPPALMALSRGISGLSFGWTSFLSRSRQVGQVVQQNNVMYYMPDFVCQNKRDKLCDSLNNAEGDCNKYYARLGMTSDGLKKFACFCENQLSKDMNFNYGFGNFEYHDNIMEIKPSYW